MHNTTSNMSTGEQWYFYRYSWFGIGSMMLLGLIIAALGLLAFMIELRAMSSTPTFLGILQQTGWAILLVVASLLFPIMAWPSICVALRGEGFLILREHSITLWTGFFSPQQVTIPLSEINSVKMRALGDRPFAHYLLGFKAGQENFTLSQSNFRSKAQFDEVAEALIAGAALNQRHESS